MEQRKSRRANRHTQVKYTQLCNRTRVELKPSQTFEWQFLPYNPQDKRLACMEVKVDPMYVIILYIVLQLQILKITLCKVMEAEQVICKIKNWWDEVLNLELLIFTSFVSTYHSSERYSASIFTCWLLIDHLKLTIGLTWYIRK